MKKTKRSLALFMSVVLVMSTFIAAFCNVTSYADDPIKEATEGWHGIFGYRFEGDDVVITDCKKGSTGNLVIPNDIDGHRVTGIGVGAFFNSDWIKSVTISDSVTRIDDSAFKSCINLSKITISKSVTSIDEWAFRNCKGLTIITVDESNKVYDSRNNCNAIIETATNKLVLGCMNSFIPYDMTEIGRFAFGDCAGLTSITIPDGVYNIDDYAFDSCTGLTSITIPDSVTRIGVWAFYDCTGLTDVYFNGTEEQWKKIEIDEGNNALRNATIHFNSAEEVLGDPTGDGAVNSADALMVLQFAVEKIALTTSQFALADVNKDSKVNSNDALLILQYVVKIIEHF